MQITIRQGLRYALLVGWCVLGCFYSVNSFVMAQEPGQQEKAAISIEAGEWKVLATSPGVKIVSQQCHDPGKLLPSGDNPLDVAQNWLAGKDFEEGRNLYKGKLIYVSIGSATVNATPADPGFIDSRLLAFQRAELEAKVKTAIFLGVDLSTSRGSSEREINPEERAQLKAIVKASPTLQDKVRRGQTAAQAEQDKVRRLRNISEASLKASACAFADVQGTQVIQSFEGSYHKNYQVVVISLWSLNLQRLVDSMQRGTAPKSLPKRAAKEEVLKQLPKDPKELACLTGVRAYVNQNGEHVLLAFGQAGVSVSGGREDKAFELAGKKARLRAMAAIRTFMGERVTFKASEKLREVLALYVDEYQEGKGAQEYKSITQFQESIQAEAEKQRITGLHGLLTRELTHPFTDKPMVLKVMAWSPSSQAMAQEVKRVIEQGPETTAPAKPTVSPKTETPTRKGIISSGKGADKDAW